MANVNGNRFGDELTSIPPGWEVAGGTADTWLAVKPQVMENIGPSTWQQVTPVAADGKRENGVGLFETAGGLWFEHAHLIPRLVQDVGNVVTEQTINCDLYNADRHNAITVSSITDNLGNGFTVTGVPTTPFNIASQDSLLFDITVLQAGDLQIDGDYTLTLSTGETYTIEIIGSRIILIPFRPEAPLKEHLQWETKITQAVDGGEQRSANRDTPRGILELTMKEGRKSIEMILFDRQAKLVGLPAWYEPSFISSAATAGDLTVNLNTTDYANFYVGGFAVVFQDEYTFDVLEIESLTATSLTFTSDLANSYAVNVQVMPLLTGFLEPTTPSVKAVYNDQTIRVKAHIRASTNDIASAAAWNTYNSKVFMDEPNMVKGQLSEVLQQKVYVLDNLSGDRSQFSQWDRGIRRSRKGFKTNSRQELWELRQLLHFLKGRQVSFYIPTFSKDIVPNQTLVNSQGTLTMDNIGYTINARNRWSKQVIRLHLNDGTILIRTIQNSAELSSSVEQLTVDTAWPYDILVTDIERIEFLEKVRFDADDIVIVHQNALGVAECIVPTKEVLD